MEKKLFSVSAICATTLLLSPMVVKAYSFDNVKETKKITIKSVKPTTTEEAYMIGELLNEHGMNLSVDTCNSDYTICTITNNSPMEEVENVKITYEYDKSVKLVADSITKNIPTNGKIFYLNDIEAIKYRLDMKNYESKNDYDSLNPISYSSEFNKLIGYKNFITEPRQGNENLVSHTINGTATFIYNGYNYAFIDNIGASYSDILYVNDNETNIEGALKTRLLKYFDIKSVTKENKTVDEYINEVASIRGNEFDKCVTLKNELDNMQDRNTPEYIEKNNNYISKCYTIMNNYSSRTQYEEHYINNDLLYEDESLGFIDPRGNNLLPNRYIVEFKDGTKLEFFVIKDSSKVFEGNLNKITSDVSTGIEVNSNGLIPLDTLINVARLTNGEKYDEIVKLLKTNLVDVFDIKLFAKSINNNITKLDNGSFEVRIPIKDELKGKDLVVYYIDDNKNIEAHQVTVKDGYAIFTTNHFSVYTLAEKTDLTSNVNTPKTGDNIIANTILFTITLLSTGTLLVIKKKKFN